MIQVFFKDDEMVASDGAYLRAIRHRKWMYLLGIGLILVSSNLYQEQNFLTTVKLFALPKNFLSSSLFLGLVYLLIIYALIIIQLFSSYTVILKSRFAFRKSDDLGVIEAKLKDIETSQKNLLKEYEIQRADYSNRMKDLQDRSDKIKLQIQKKVRDLSVDININSKNDENDRSNLEDYINYSNDLSKSLDSLRSNMIDFEYRFNESSKSYNSQHSELIIQKQEILKQDFYQNKKYRYSEIAIDIFKLSVAPLVALYSLYSYFN